METASILPIVAVAAAAATLVVAAGLLLCRLIRQSGPGSFMWHD